MTTLHTYIKNHAGSKTDLARTIIDSTEGQPVQRCLDRAKAMPKMHDVSAVELMAASLYPDRFGK